MGIYLLFHKRDTFGIYAQFSILLNLNRANLSVSRLIRIGQKADSAVQQMT